MNLTEIEFALRDLASKPYDAEAFPYDLLAIFNASKMTVSRLKSGATNKATRQADVLWQKQFFLRPAHLGEDVGAVGDALLSDSLTVKHKPRLIVVTNGLQVHIRDVKLAEAANVEFERLDEQSHFLLPLPATNAAPSSKSTRLTSKQPRNSKNSTTQFFPEVRPGIADITLTNSIC